MAKQAIFTLDLNETKEVKGKGNTVLEIVRQYVAHNPSVTSTGLKRVFNTLTLLRGGQVITLKVDALNDTANIDDNGCNYFLKDIITLNNGEEVVVWCYWPDKFFQPFLEMVQRDLGYKITMNESSEEE